MSICPFAGLYCSLFWSEIPLIIGFYNFCRVHLSIYWTSLFTIRLNFSVHFTQKCPFTGLYLSLLLFNMHSIMDFTVHLFSTFYGLYCSLFVLNLTRNPLHRGILRRNRCDWNVHFVHFIPLKWTLPITIKKIHFLLKPLRWVLSSLCPFSNGHSN